MVPVLNFRLDVLVFLDCSCFSWSQTVAFGAVSSRAMARWTSALGSND